MCIIIDVFGTRNVCLNDNSCTMLSNTCTGVSKFTNTCILLKQSQGTHYKHNVAASALPRLMRGGSRQYTRPD